MRLRVCVLCGLLLCPCRIHVPSSWQLQEAEGVKMQLWEAAIGAKASVEAALAHDGQGITFCGSAGAVGGTGTAPHASAALVAACVEASASYKLAAPQLQERRLTVFPDGQTGQQTGSTHVTCGLDPLRPSIGVKHPLSSKPTMVRSRRFWRVPLTDGHEVPVCHAECLHDKRSQQVRWRLGSRAAPPEFLANLLTWLPRGRRNQRPWLPARGGVALLPA